MANGFCYTITLHAHHENKPFEWQEKRLVVRSLKQAVAQEKALVARLEKAQKAMAELNLHGRGRKCLDENAMTEAVNTLLERYNVVGILATEMTLETQSVHKRAYSKRSVQTVI